MKTKIFLRASTAVFALAIASPGWAQASDDQATVDQETQADSEDTDSDGKTIIVTGLRNSLDTAQARKRNSDQIIDSVEAEDIGRLPDTNIVESLQRIPGVQIERRYGEGGAEVAIKSKQNTPAVAIRGLTQVRYLIDGRDTYSAGGGRNLAVEAFPPEILAGIDVYKNPSAEMIEGGIGGLVNLRTRLPFDQNWRLMYATGRVNYYDLADKTGGSASAMYSNRWNTDIGEFGLLINPVYSKTYYRQDSILVQPFYDVSNGEPLPGAPEGARTPLGFQIYDESGDRERFSISGALQWQMNPDVLFTMQALHADYWFKRQGKYAWTIASADPKAPVASWVLPQPTPGAEFTYAPDGRVTSGSYDTAVLQVGRNDQNLHSRDQNFTVNLAWNPVYNLTVKLDGQYLKSIYNADESGFTIIQYSGAYDKLLDENGEIVVINDRKQVFDQRPWSSPNRSILDFDLRGRPTWTLRSPTSASDPDSYYYSNIGNYRTRNKSDQLAFRADLQWDINAPVVKTVSLGGRYANSDVTIRRLSEYYTTYTLGTVVPDDWWRGWDRPDHNYYVPSATHPELITPGPSDNFFDGRTVSSLYYPVLPDGKNVSDRVGRLFEIFGAPRRENFWPSETNRQGEETLTGYGSVKLADYLSGMPLDANFGLRVVHTKASSDGYLYTKEQDLDPNDPADLTPVNARNNYTFILPSANIRLGITDDFQLRFAYAKAMARPDFWQMGTYVILNPPPIDPQAGRPKGWAGNPFLKPIESNQFDFSAEWYFSRTGSLTGALFYKDVSGFLASGIQVRPYNGVDYDIHTQLNSGNGKIKGFEIAYQQFYDFLPGFLSGLGLQANYTYVDSNVENPFATADNNAPINVPLEKLSKNSFNLIGLYDKDRLSARLAYSWRSSYLNTTVGSGANNLPQKQAPYANLDASISYKVTDKISATLEGVNLTNRMGRTYIGTPSEPLQYSLNDRRFSLILRAYY